MELFSEKLILISLFIFIIHSIDTLAYAVRLSGARVKLLASALSLFNLMVIVSRMANMMQQPFTGSLIDNAPKVDTLVFVEHQYRVIIGSSTLGTIMGILLLPTFISIFSRAIIHLSEERGSIPALIKKGFTIEYIKRGVKHIHLPKSNLFKGYSVEGYSNQIVRNQYAHNGHIYNWCIICFICIINSSRKSINFYYGIGANKWNCNDFTYYFY